MRQLRTRRLAQTSFQKSINVKAINVAVLSGKATNASAIEINDIFKVRVLLNIVDHQLRRYSP
jgi:hypothetical protein